MPQVKDKQGVRYRVRPIAGEDRRALQRAYAGLAPSDKRAAFFTQVPDLGDEAAASLCTVDHTRETCLVLEQVERPGELAGGCRLVGSGASIAEFSVWLRSDVKRLGLGRSLMELLLEEAKARNFHTVLGHVLADNIAMLHLVRGLGFTVERDPDDFELITATWRAPDRAPTGA